MNLKSALQGQTAAVVLYLLLAIPFLFAHNLFEEWDGVMQYFAGTQIIAGRGYCGWESNFWPPLYSLLIGIGSLVADGFWVAKVISLVSAAALIFLVHEIAMDFFGSKKVSLISQYMLIFNPFFFLPSIQAENHMLDSLFFVSGLLVYLRALNGRFLNGKGFLLAGGLIGLAGLSRYTSYSFVPIALVAPFFLYPSRHRRSLVSAAQFLGAFSIISAPWWLYNAHLNGSPLHTWQYLNIGSSVAKYAGIDSGEWWWIEAANYSGLKDIIHKMPLAYLKNFATNLRSSILLVFKSTAALSPFLIPSLFALLLCMRLRVLAILLAAGAVFILLVSQAFVFQEVFLSWAIVLTPICVAWIDKYVDKLSIRFAFQAKPKLFAMAIATLITVGMALTFRVAIAYTQNDDDGGQLSDVTLVSQALKSDRDISSKYVMAIHPGRAFYSASKYMMMPLAFDGSVQELVSYKYLNPKIAKYSPQYPAYCNSTYVPVADYLVFDMAAKSALPQFSFLLEKNSVNIPSNFEVVYRSESVAVFRIGQPSVKERPIIDAT